MEKQSPYLGSCNSPLHYINISLLSKILEIIYIFLFILQIYIKYLIKQNKLYKILKFNI
nr:MAG TPA_asm: hypothetical protein [Caudoviricetes sp.]